MKRWILSLALLTLGFTASAQNDLIDRGELAPEIAAASGEKMEWLPSFNGVIVEGLFRIRFERVPMDQAPKIVFNTKGVYDSRFTAEVNKNKMLVISERIAARKRALSGSAPSDLPLSGREGAALCAGADHNKSGRPLYADHCRRRYGADPEAEPAESGKREAGGGK